MKRTVFILLLLASLSSAYTLDMTVKDINTLKPISGAVLNITSKAADNDILSDVNGEAISYGIENDTWYNITAAGYHSSFKNFINITNDTGKLVLMYPIQSEGIIRVNFFDDTISYGDRKICLFFEENGRLYKCVKVSSNETLQLLNNHGYIARIETSWVDQVSSYDGFMDNIYDLLPKMAFMGLFIVFFIYLIGRRN